MKAEELRKESGETMVTGFTTTNMDDGTVVVEMPFVYNK